MYNVAIKKESNENGLSSLVTSDISLHEPFTKFLTSFSNLREVQFLISLNLIWFDRQQRETSNFKHVDGRG